MLVGDLAVVPIFVNAGAALLPALAAGLATFFAMLFKPRVLLKACREKPGVPITILLIGVGIWAIVHVWPAPDETSKETSRRSSGREAAAGTDPATIDWTEVALARIRAREIGGYVYGDDENGGTGTFYVSPVPFEKIDAELRKREKERFFFPENPNPLKTANIWAEATLAAPVAAVAGAIFAGARALGAGKRDTVRTRKVWCGTGSVALHQEATDSRPVAARRVAHLRCPLHRTVRTGGVAAYLPITSA